MATTIYVLLVEDDRDLAASIGDYLQLEGIECDFAHSGPAALQLATREAYDVILLDLTLPRLDGLHVCERLRDRGTDVPVLMVTARDTLEHKLAGFRAGTDDYLVKPFAMEELVMRVRALSTRRSGQVRVLRFADLEMNLVSREVKRGNNRLRITGTGWTLLETLLRAAPKVVSRSDLERALWSDNPPDSDSLKVHLFRLRQLVDKPFANPLIHTVPGHGFALREDDDSQDHAAQ